MIRNRLKCAMVLAVAFVMAGPAFAQAPSAPAVSSDLSGMFTFLKEGEFVQLTVDDGQLTGFVSRFGDTDSDKGQFIDQFFDKASLQGDHLHFTTKPVHAIWYEFDGTLTTVAGKQKGEEGYRVIRGKLTLHSADAKGVEHASERTVEFKSFPDMRMPKN
ncbi:MAG: hypothetical protein WAN69_03050 [Candidatus Korobacteraceae bacterium]